MDKVKLKKWDIVEHLDTEEDMENYLEACFEEGDPALIAAALGDIARVRGMSKVVCDAGLYNEGKTEFATVIKVIKAMGLKLVAKSIE